jgi:serine/threonine protein kinase
MGLTSGSRIGPYEVMSPLGSGGMGEVYRARDMKLGRDVALKVVPDAFANDPDRLARFQREAQVLASVNHPNIAHIYGLEESGEAHCIVMELIEGETLAAMLMRGALSIDEALTIATQIAEALDAAHGKGIVHRDLKPGNVMVLPDGKVKVLDFGLAKPLEKTPANQSFSNSPTLDVTATGAGVILGTAAYMAPEQVRGRSIDKRADIWAFGCVLYEMLTGRQAFAGEDATDILARIVQGEPDWGALPSKTPSKIRQLIARCLTKDPVRRLRDIGDARIEIEEGRLAQPEPQTKRHALPRILVLSGSVILIVLLIAAAVIRLSVGSENITPRQAIRFSISPPNGWRFLEAPIAQEIAISPDGKRVAFTVQSTGFGTGGQAIAYRAFDALNSELVPGTEGGRAAFWSPDATLSWIRVRQQAEAYRMTALDSSHNEFTHAFPWFLPDGRHFLYTAWSTFGSGPMRVGAVDTKETTSILSSDSGGQYAAGHLFFINAGKLMVQRFDQRKLQLLGDPQRLVEPVFTNPAVPGYPGFGVSSDFVAFESGNVPETQLVWLDRSGKEVAVVGKPDRYIGVRLSPRETDAAVVRYDSQNRSFDIWITSLHDGVPSRSTFDPWLEGLPVWSPAGESIVFPGFNTVNKKLVNGSSPAEVVMKADNQALDLSSWSSDGRYIVYTNSAVLGGDIGLLPISGDKKPISFLHESFDHADPQISPDSKWIAYSSYESGKPEIYIVSFPKPEGKWQVSANGGVRPKWRNDGKELFYLSPAGEFMAVDVNGGAATFQKSAPKSLFKVPGPRIEGWFYNYDVAQNGQRFLFNKVLESSEAPTITIISNWQSLVQ